MRIQRNGISASLTFCLAFSFVLAMAWTRTAHTTTYQNSTECTLSFVTSPPFSTGNGPVSITKEDFNGDGKIDLAIANHNSSNVTIHLGNGNGTFQSPVHYITGTNAQTVATGHFNGDSRIDLAVANSGSNNVSILLGNGDGTFQPRVNFASGGAYPTGVAIGDFNGDARSDLVLTNNGSSNISVLLGNGNGTFQSAVNYGSGINPNYPVAEDLNGDGKIDLAVPNQGTNNVAIFLGNGNGTFQPPVYYPAGSGAVKAATGDFNGDNRIDLVVSNPFSANVSILLSNGNGTFQPAVNYGVGNGPYFVTVADFNGDTFLDLATANYFSNTTSILLGNGDGTFQLGATYNVQTNPQSLVNGDFNGDGKPDLAVANSNSNTVSILLNDSFCLPTTTGTNMVLFGVPELSNTPQSIGGGIYRFQVPPTGNPVLDATISDSSFYNPFGLALSPEGELFVTNRGPNFGQGGSISRLLNPTGTPASNGVINSADFYSPHGVAFRGNELFAAQGFSNTVLRFVIGSAGNASPNGAISAGLANNRPRGVAVSPWGEIFVSQCCGANTISRYLIDGDGNAVPNGVITGGGLNNPHDMEFSQQGYLFVANADGNSVSRFTFDAQKNASSAGQINSATFNGPIGLAFSPSGELFVCNHANTTVSRFTFNGSNAVLKGTFSAPISLRDIEFAPSTSSAVDDFSFQNNPNNTWSYGWVNSQCSPNFNLYDVPETRVLGVQGWTSEGLPDVLRNINPSSVIERTITHETDMLTLHPGPGGELSVVRWTAANAGRYRFQGKFQGLDFVGQTTTNVAILHNTTDALFVNNINGFGITSAEPFSVVVDVNAGDFVDFTVGYGNNQNYFYDSTGLAVNVVAVSPATTLTPVSPNPACDPVPPSTTSALNPTASLGWNNSDVNVSLSSIDNTGGTGVREIVYSAAGAQTIPSTTVNGTSANFAITAEGETTVTYFARDNAGNTEAAHTLMVKIDKTAPALTSQATTGGNQYTAGTWTNQNVVVSFDCTDALSGVASVTQPITLSSEGGNQTANGVCTDVAGNSANASSLNIKIDKTAPVITITTPTNGSYLLNQAVTTNYTCSDGGSGVASCTGTTANGSSLDTDSIGGKTFSVNSTDNAGNSASPTTVNYTVGFGIQALFDQTKAHKSGSTVPIKIRLVDANGANVSSATTVVHAVSVIQTGSQASPILEDAGNANPDYDFRYDQSSESYIFNLKTSGYGTGTYQLNFIAGNGSLVYSVGFQVRQ